ncbi:MAG: DUF503 domain-containing protein [Chloroflexi bacterium]|nr:DUF503 domain-containing protein [Chloroflexota bacterium]
MVIGVCTLELQVPDSESLKQKRQVIRSFMARLRQQYNVALAEVDHQDSWQLATLAIVAVSNDLAYVQGLLERAVQAVEGGRHGLVLLDYSVEII